jgi:hypothetical protein
MRISLCSPLPFTADRSSGKKRCSCAGGEALHRLDPRRHGKTRPASVGRSRWRCLVELDASFAGEPVDVEDIELLCPQDDDAVLAHCRQTATHGLAGEAKRVGDMRLHQGQSHARRLSGRVQLAGPDEQLNQQICDAFARRSAPDIREMLEGACFSAGEELDKAQGEYRQPLQQLAQITDCRGRRR